METTVVYYPSAGAPLTRPEIAEVLAGAMASNPKLAAALRQIVAERHARASSRAAEEGLSERDAAHAGGRMAELLSLQHELANYVKAADELRTRKPLARAKGGA